MKLFPIASDGWRFILPLFGVAVILFFFQQDWSYCLGGLCCAVGCFCVYFFRDFDRATAPDEALIYSPADGRILEVSRVTEPEKKDWRLIRIFLSVLNVHVQRAPIAGSVGSIQYKKGVFLDARHPDAHFRNEQNALVIKSNRGEVLVTQIAGLIARRIVCWVKQGDSLSQGERFGLIRFGSQVDVLLPPGAKIQVEVGDFVEGGTTVLANWGEN